MKSEHKSAFTAARAIWTLILGIAFLAMAVSVGTRLSGEQVAPTLTSHALSRMSSAEYVMLRATDTPNLHLRIVLMDSNHTSYTGAIHRVSRDLLCLTVDTEPGDVCVEQAKIGAIVFLEPTEEVTR